jgi:translation initiation factor 1 (eIF-1/SUI1)
MEILQPVCRAEFDIQLTAISLFASSFKEARIEIQGDQREAVTQVLTTAGFQPVFAGE